jgi:hypothetical protein
MSKDNQSHRIDNGGCPKRFIGGFLALEINFSGENGEIFMNPLKKMGISPIVEFSAQK